MVPDGAGRTGRCRCATRGAKCLAAMQRVDLDSALNLPLQERESGVTAPLHRGCGVKSLTLRCSSALLDRLEHRRHALMDQVDGLEWAQHDLEFGDLSCRVPLDQV